MATTFNIALTSKSSLSIKKWYSNLNAFHFYIVRGVKHVSHRPEPPYPACMVTGSWRVWPAIDCRASWSCWPWLLAANVGHNCTYPQILVITLVSCHYWTSIPGLQLPLAFLYVTPQHLWTHCCHLWTHCCPHGGYGDCSCA